jgi:hypothetical protein
MKTKGRVHVVKGNFVPETVFSQVFLNFAILVKVFCHVQSFSD